MAINKVVYGNDTLIDLTEDTATADDVLNGKTFHLKNGVRATGNASFNIDMDLLWTNASPTSAFGAQTLNIDLSNYKLIMVEASGTGYQNVNNDKYRSTFIIRVNSGKNSILQIPSNADVWGTRTYTVTSSRITVTEGTYVGQGSNNYACVPQVIYGIK